MQPCGEMCRAGDTRQSREEPGQPGAECDAGGRRTERDEKHSIKTERREWVETNPAKLAARCAGKILERCLRANRIQHDGVDPSFSEKRLVGEHGGYLGALLGGELAIGQEHERVGLEADEPA